MGRSRIAFGSKLGLREVSGSAYRVRWWVELKLFFLHRLFFKKKMNVLLQMDSPVSSTSTIFYAGNPLVELEFDIKHYSRELQGIDGACPQESDVR
jgi:hypothetical protein